uniref:ATP-dependent RNA helicase n=1 Tax=Spongospora subterranea TaxID=70186 RepID=A0A0H5QLY5_9EUKA|eukprot:CRZ03018.1 hypothetical protein [Spongospora subterranea]
MYEIFRRIVPAASIAKPATTSNPQRGHRSGRHRQQHYTPGFYQLHGGMTQTQRLAVFNDFTKATHGVMFATDLAARGLDFTSVSWVIQVDCPDTPETYIHRVGRTARFRSAGRALLMLLPGETAMLDLLRSKRVELKRVKANPSQMRSDIVNGRLRSLLAQLPDLKYTAQAAFVSYCRTLHLAANKDVFRLENIDAGKLALSMGLVGTPKITFAGFGSGSRHDLKNMSMSLRDIVQGDKAKTGEDDKISRLLKRKNATIYHESRTRLRADNEDEEDDEEDFLTIGGRQDETTEKRQKKMNPSNADAIIDEDMIAEYGNQLKIVLAQADTECDKNADQLRVKQMHKASKRKLRQRRKIEYDHDESDDDEEGDDEEESVSDEDRVLGEEQMEAMARSVMNSRQ